MEGGAGGRGRGQGRAWGPAGSLAGFRLTRGFGRSTEAGGATGRPGSSAVSNGGSPGPGSDPVAGSGAGGRPGLALAGTGRTGPGGREGRNLLRAGPIALHRSGPSTDAFGGGEAVGAARPAAATSPHLGHEGAKLGCPAVRGMDSWQSCKDFVSVRALGCPSRLLSPAPKASQAPPPRGLCSRS